MTNQYLEKIAARLSRNSVIESGKTVLDMHSEYNKRKTKSTKKSRDTSISASRSRGTGRKWARGSANK